ncbi:c-type cytochrome biogenesis protein CcsB [Brachybacterium saurashtrense]|uniref:C-type cytochrome biogenesis protein CcsB n=1 Tax=Brachybacterium saurashtrense TaxID=556288 RepID=A0A345YPI6_9MICO|nr:c-type cytochrome biogenesis protein CcsB [Brachybacterium saurashtrense]AXK45838.1 c-type cytochrome biogenesis protein CcsB [Brachybacterium saurashtrense]RRR24857.1 c-type cytochrome biogenesis protein CcsB [Brachybacterium saurashtrense]
MINEQLAEISNLALVVTIVLYVLALIGFGADLASTTQRRSDARLGALDRKDAPALQAAAVGADAGPGGASGGAVTGEAPAPGPIPDGSRTGAMSAQRFAFLLAGAATVLHVLGVTTRALATQRVPWANMYEFATTSTAVVMLAFLVFSIRRVELRALGTFVVGPVLLVLLLAQTFWIVPAAELTPSLQNSHWIYIHIGVAVIATALSILGAVVAGLQLLQARHEQALVARVAAGEEHPEHWGRAGHVLDRLPSSTVLEALSFRIHSVAFVCWTFTLIFGAIWAREAWGRFWGWDPKEVWTFIIWVIYAAYLHARATGGFRGSRAAGLALAGFVAVVFNYTIVNTVINGLHSYSGL